MNGENHMGTRSALLVSSSEFQDSTLAQLTAPQNDVNSFAAVLRDPSIGNFDEVKVLINEPSYSVREEMEEFFSYKKRDDLALIYFSGHGVLDLNGKLYLATPDTKCHVLRSTAIPANYLTEVMDDSRTRRVVLILDCCHSGAFARGGKGSAVGTSVGTGTVFEGMGYGRIVLTASDATQYAWEGEQIQGSSVGSVFTNFLVEGLRTGAADLSKDGKITLDELYDYIYGKIMQQDSNKRQTPGKWSFKQKGELVIAKNPVALPQPKITPLPDELRAAIYNPLADVRFGAINSLVQFLKTPGVGVNQAALDALIKLSDDDSRRVSEAAKDALSNQDVIKRKERAAQDEVKHEHKGSSIQKETNSSQNGYQKKITSIQKRKYWFIASGLFLICCIVLLSINRMNSEKKLELQTQSRQVEAQKEAAAEAEANRRTLVQLKKERSQLEELQKQGDSEEKRRLEELQKLAELQKKVAAEAETRRAALIQLEEERNKLEKLQRQREAEEKRRQEELQKLAESQNNQKGIAEADVQVKFEREKERLEKRQQQSEDEVKWQEKNIMRLAETQRKIAAEAEASRIAQDELEQEKKRLEIQQRQSEAEERIRQKKFHDLISKQDQKEKQLEIKFSGTLLHADQIKNLVNNKKAIGIKVDDSDPISWEESQYSNGQAIFKKAGGNEVEGSWKIDSNTLCWCYGNCESYQCKYILKRNSEYVWYYIDPENENKTGKITEWRELISN
ncbi:MAG: hypothetical protein D3914_06185 [Candidatus Electrothrix sp. LOE2]|nr:hypothetical protein [Candidatus Electrothrix sp. LOE2]